MESITCLSELLVKSQSIHLLEGDQQGYCAFCGRNGTNLFKLKLKETFTQLEYIHNSKYICSECKHLYDEPLYRMNGWICTKNEFKIVARSDMINSILQLNENDCPFAIYTTDTYKKQGWLILLCNLNFSTQQITIAWDMTKINVSKNEILTLSTFATELRTLGLYKSEILSGMLCRKSLDKFENEISILRRLEELKDKIIWQWVVAFTK
jgi:ribosomal protein L37AE/L43A